MSEFDCVRSSERLYKVLYNKDLSISIINTSKSYLNHCITTEQQDETYLKDSGWLLIGILKLFDLELKVPTALARVEANDLGFRRIAVDAITVVSPKPSHERQHQKGRHVLQRKDL